MSNRSLGRAGRVAMTALVAATVWAASMSAPVSANAADDVPLPDWQSFGSQSSAVPADAVPGSTPERRTAWESLSEEQRARMLTKFQDDVGARVQADVEAQAQAHAQSAPAAPSWEDVVSGKAASLATPGPRPVFTERAPEPASAIASAASAASPASVASDADGDGLPESFENQVADAFTPFYHVSGGEAPGTGFALFANQVPLAIQQNLPPTPPVSHFRVRPLGFGSAADGTPLSVLRLDYLTLWNRDDGLDSGGACLATAGVLFGLVGLTVGEVLQGVKDHKFDLEHSAALVAAPVTGPTINLDPSAYKAYAYYTTAHEGEPLFDKSTFILPDQPVPAGTHIQLALARAKHGTYSFNPNGMPMLPAWLIVLVYDTINFLFLADIIDEVQYLIYSFIADSVFFGCVIERFEEQGGQFAQTRINVGEPEMPINQSAFINDTQTLGGLRNKLVDNLFFFFQPGPPPPPRNLAVNGGFNQGSGVVAGDAEDATGSPTVPVSSVTTRTRAPSSRRPTPVTAMVASSRTSRPRSTPATPSVAAPRSPPKVAAVAPPAPSSSGCWRPGGNETPTRPLPTCPVATPGHRCRPASPPPAPTSIRIQFYPHPEHPNTNHRQRRRTPQPGCQWWVQSGFWVVAGDAADATTSPTVLAVVGNDPYEGTTVRGDQHQ